jgi:cellulose synthase/poly-beta-1,6-N-acetylglucosamine synthase-like glycosyltransferase
MHGADGHPLLLTTAWIVLSYWLLLHSTALGACLLSFRALRHYARRLKAIDIESLLEAAGAPPITLMLPLHNAGPQSLTCMQQLLRLHYPKYEVLIINDGSSDDTLKRLQTHFALQPTPRFPVSELPSAPIHTIYQSQQHPHLWVIDKARGGMADALNAGLNFCQTPLYCTTYATMQLERNALLRAVRPFLENAATVAVSGIIRVRNHCQPTEGDVTEVHLPAAWSLRMQIIEHLRFFLVSYMAGSVIRSLMLVSGAFVMFRRTLVVEAGGYDTRFRGETPELLLRLHRFCRESERPYHVDFIPDPMAWHECPQDLHTIRQNRMDWQEAITRALWHHRAMLWRRGSGRMGWLIYPLLLAYENGGAFLELTSYVLILSGALTQTLPPLMLLALVLAAGLMGSAPAALAVALGECTPHRYQDQDLRQLLHSAWLEYLSYHPLRALWRAQAVINAFRRPPASIPESLEY